MKPLFLHANMKQHGNTTCMYRHKGKNFENAKLEATRPVKDKVKYGPRAHV